MSPTDASAQMTTPVTINVRVASGTVAAAMQVLLDGVDITSRFTPADGSGVRRAEVDRPLVNWGENQILVKSGLQQVNSHFFLDDHLDSSPAVANLPLLIPIKTRVVTGSGDKATDYNIALYKDPNDPTAATLIPAPAPQDGSNAGFQVVLLKRSDLSVVSNVSVGRLNPPREDGQYYSSRIFGALLAYAVDDCGGVGCIIIVQSLGTIGFTPCYAPNAQKFPKDCEAFGNQLHTLGLSSRLVYANGDSTHIAFSSISNTPPTINNHTIFASAGSFFESLTCSGSNYGGGPACDSLGSPNTSFTAPKGASPSQLGDIAGVLIRDNHRNFTFSRNDRLVSFSTATIPNGPDGLTHTTTVDGVSYASGSLRGSQGGFHLLILNSKDLSLVKNQTFPGKVDASHVNGLYDSITGYKSYGYLFFVAAFGDSRYFCYPGSTSGPCGARATWYNGSQLMEALGGTQQVFYLANNPQVTPFRYDDYTLVGSFVDGVGGESTNTGLAQVGAEMSSVISRETEGSPPIGMNHGADMEGFLRVNSQGFYSPVSFGHRLNLSKTKIADILSASLLNPTPWPFPGPDPAGSKAAYDWISRQLCCTDIRSAYVNLNISPGIWLAELRHLAYDSSKIPNSSAADFDAMVQQLTTEFQYVTLARLFQSNVVGLYQDQQANVSLLFQDASDTILNNLQVGLTTKAHAASWTGILSDVFGIGSSLLNAIPGGGIVAAGTEVALTVGTAIANQAASHTNSPAGTPLQAQENQEIAAGDLANQLANQFSATLVSLGSEFDRVVTDWGRLKTLAAPLLADQVPWDDNATGLLLEGYDRAVQRELYAQLLPTNFVVQRLPYTGHDLHVQNTYFDHGDSECVWEQFAKNNAVLYYPNGRINDDKHDGDAGIYPWNYQWGIWALTLAKDQNGSCPGRDMHYPNTHDYPDTFGLFQPLDPGNPDALGAYRYWFYTRGNFQIIENNDNTPCYDGAC
ncbi:MAG: hypothetical protein NPIRA06_30710 [Nitrospirales bacterium]|nr:MAG: hypothetical protein NPIRA06_30710 [Nitrospirales bacterium]